MQGDSVYRLSGGTLPGDAYNVNNLTTPPEIPDNLFASA